MQPRELAQLSVAYQRDGFITGVPVVDTPTARRHREALEKAEQHLSLIHI